MISLTTGLPGNFKTAHEVYKLYLMGHSDEGIFSRTLGFLRYDLFRRPRPEKPSPRRVFTNIPLTDKGKELMPWVSVVDNETLSKWYDLPEGSLIVIDEVQKVFPTRGPSQKVPEGVAQLATHRHKGFDIVFITQHTRLLDSWARSFVQVHDHYDRPQGAPGGFRYSLEGCMDDPPKDVASPSFAGVSVPVVGPKKIYELYKSATIHNVKFRLSKLQVVVGVFCVLMAVWAAWSFRNVYHQFFAKDEKLGSGESVEASAELAGLPGLAPPKIGTGGATSSGYSAASVANFHPDCWSSGSATIAGERRIYISCRGQMISQDDLTSQGFSVGLTRQRLGNQGLSPLPIFATLQRMETK